MARTKIVLFKSNIRRDGSCPVCLRVAKEDKTKYIDLQLSATKGQWDELASRFKKDKRVNPNYENYNALKSLDLSLAMTNVFTIASGKLKGQDPTQANSTTINMSLRPAYTFALNVSF